MTEDRDKACPFVIGILDGGAGAGQWADFLHPKLKQQVITMADKYG
jgi:hypothetical protein